MKRSPMPARKAPMRRTGPPARRTPLKSRSGVGRYRTAVERAAYRETRHDRARLADYVCEAEGLHHPDCPGEWFPPSAGLGYFVTHHVLPFADGGSDDVGNLRFVWNGWTPFGAGGCHGRIHTRAGLARDLGLLE